MCQNEDSWKIGVSKMADPEAAFSSSSNINKNDNNSKKQPETVGTNFVGVLAHNQTFTAIKEVLNQEKAIFKLLRKFLTYLAFIPSLTPSTEQS